MRKFTALLMIAALAFSAAACKKPTVVINEGTVAEGGSTGGWTVDDPEEIELPEGAKEAFEQAMEGYDGAGFAPIGYLGSQVVAGTNYKYLCKETVVSEDPELKLSVVTVYVDLENNASVSNVENVDIVHYLNTKKEFAAEELLGGWYVDEAFGCGITGHCKEAFEAATADYTGVGFEPIAVLGFQVVAGMKYVVLCKATTVTAEPVSGLCAVELYAGADGTHEIQSVNAFEY